MQGLATEADEGIVLAMERKESRPIKTPQTKPYATLQ